ncbi:hypothetical protein QWZ08_17080 [Ferruginibacter paludis]|nr:hypothetical protein [Ferruginibacter paludis]MDN3657368.1 hypothetical protein [Ferruginibacter paludis]
MLTIFDGAAIMIGAKGTLLLLAHLLSGTRIANAPSLPYTLAPKQTSLQ